MNYLSFDYEIFNYVGISVSPFDAPNEGYELIGDHTCVIYAHSALLDKGLKSSDITDSENHRGKYDYLIKEYVEEYTILQALKGNADAIFAFKTTPLTKSAKDQYITGFKLCFVMARTLNSDGSYKNELPSEEIFQKSYSLVTSRHYQYPDQEISATEEPTLVIESTYCLAIVNGYYKDVQCKKKPSSKKNNGYCTFHQYYVKERAD